MQADGVGEVEHILLQREQGFDIPAPRPRLSSKRGLTAPPAAAVARSGRAPSGSGSPRYGRFTRWRLSADARHAGRHAPPGRRPYRGDPSLKEHGLIERPQRLAVAVAGHADDSRGAALDVKTLFALEQDLLNLAGRHRPALLPARAQCEPAGEVTARVIYDIRHVTTYAYESPVSFARCSLRLSRSTGDGQQ